MLWYVPFLLMTVVALPLLAILSSRASRSAQAELPSRRALYIQLLVIQLIVGGLAAPRPAPDAE